MSATILARRISCSFWRLPIPPWSTTRRPSLVYTILGIREYWVADLQNGRLLAHTQPEGDRYTVIAELHPGDFIAPQLLPQCRLNVDLLLP